MRTWRTTVTSLLIAAGASVAAQDTLGLERAIALALASEHGILIARNAAAIADAQATPGMAGMLPRLDAGGRASYSNQDTRLDFTDGIPDVERNGVVNTAWSGQLGLGYTVFNGLGNFAALERARVGAQLADLRLRAQVEGTLTQVIALYYALAAMAEDVSITQRILGISQERLERLQARAALGGAGRLEVLNAQVDLQADSAAHVLALQRRERTMRDLNVLLGRPSADVFTVRPRIVHADGLAQERLVEEALAGNVQLLAAAAQVHAAEVDQRIARSLRWPRIDLSATYGLNDQQNGVGLVLGTYTQGLNAGLTLSMPLYDGGRIATQAAQSRLLAESARLAEEQARAQVERDVLNAFTSWRAQRELLRIQREAVRVAQVNFERTLELYRSGQLTGLQFRQAQLDLAGAERQAVVAGFDTKVAEVTLLRASGGLLPALGVRPE